MPFCRSGIAQGELHLRHQGVRLTLMRVNPKGACQMYPCKCHLLSREGNLSKPEFRKRIVGLEGIRAG